MFAILNEVQPKAIKNDWQTLQRFLEYSLRKANTLAPLIEKVESTSTNSTQQIHLPNGTVRVD